MSNLHLLLDEANKHNPKGFDPAINNTFPWKDELGLSTYREQMELPKAINFVDGTVAAPTTVDGDVYVLTGSGVIDGSWGNATFGDWVRFTNTIATEITPLTGYLCYDVTAASWMEYDGAVWAVFGGGGGNTIYTADGTIAGPRTVTMAGNLLSFNGGNMAMTGRVGIGIADPSAFPAKLYIKGETDTTAAWTIRTDNSSGVTAFVVKDDGQIFTKDDIQVLVDGSFGGKLGVGVPNVEGNITGSARFSVRGFGSTSGTTALLVENSSGTDLLKVNDDGSTTINGEITQATPASNARKIHLASQLPADHRAQEIYSGGWNYEMIRFGVVTAKLAASGHSLVQGLDIYGDLFQESLTANGRTLYLTAQLPAAYSIKEKYLGGWNTEWTNNSIVKARIASTTNSWLGIDAASNFGVGIAAPTAKLHVLGSTLLDGNLGVFGTTPIAQGAALTATLTSTTQAGSFTPDYAIQAVTQTTPFGFVTADEAETFISTVINMQTRIDELEARLDSSTGIGVFT